MSAYLAIDAVVTLLTRQPGLTPTEVVDHFFPRTTHPFSVGDVRAALSHLLYVGGVDMAEDRSLRVFEPAASSPVEGDRQP